jgi:hypothetical protein
MMIRPINQSYKSMHKIAFIANVVLSKLLVSTSTGMFQKEEEDHHSKIYLFIINNI